MTDEAGSAVAPAAVSRRRVLGALAAAGVAGAVGPLARRVSAAEDLDNGTRADRRWVFVVDLRRCDGCKECIKGCQKMHHLPETKEWIKVHEYQDTVGNTIFFPVLCQMCDNAPCVRVCPVAATYHTSDGVVLVDQSVCIGCRMCMAACPYGVRVFNWEAEDPLPDLFRSDTPEFQAPQIRGTVGKCQNCIHLVRDGKLPACVEWCSMRALYVGDLHEDVATNGQETVVLSRLLRDNDAFRFKEELGTEPNVYYIAGHGQHVEY